MYDVMNISIIEENLRMEDSAKDVEEFVNENTTNE